MRKSGIPSDEIMNASVTGGHGFTLASAPNAMGDPIRHITMPEPGRHFVRSHTPHPPGRRANLSPIRPSRRPGWRHPEFSAGE
jgi:hypothetical protein